MPEAVIVSAARSPIGRANKGSLKDFRPDDLAALIVADRAGQDPGAGPAHRRRPLPRLRPARRRDAATTWAGSSTSSTAWTTCPAPPSPATAPPRCRPPGWPSTRSRPARATCSSPPASRPSPASPRAPPTTGPTPSNPLFADAKARTDKTGRGRRQDWHDPREDGAAARRLHRDGPDRRERRHAARPDPRGARRVRRPLAEPRREGDRRRLLGPRDHPGHHARRHRGRHADDGPRAGVTYRGRLASSSRSSAPTASSPPATAAPLNDGAAAVVDHVRHQGRRARPHPAGPDRLHRRQRPLPRDHGPRPGRGDQAGAGPRRHDASATSTWSRSTRRSPRRSCRRTRTSASTSTGSTSTAARSRSATRSA